MEHRGMGRDSGRFWQEVRGCVAVLQCCCVAVPDFAGSLGFHFAPVAVACPPMHGLSV